MSEPSFSSAKNATGLALMKGRKFLIGLVGVVFFVWLLFQTIDSNGSDTNIVLQTFTGDLTVITEPGPYFRFFGTPNYYKKVIAVNFTGERSVNASSILPPIPVRFVDTSTGVATGVARFRLPSGSEDLVQMHREFGNQSNLISNLLERFVIESAKSATRIMSVEQHYSGGAGQLSLDFDDQLRNGIFVTEQLVEEEMSQASETEGEDSPEQRLEARQRVIVKKKLDAQGQIIRTPNPLLSYNISVINGSIQDVDYEDKVDDRLAAQKQAAADEALARQNLKKAQQEAKTAAALGEKAIAEQRASSEREKLQAEITAEKEASVARINEQRDKEVALIRAQRQVDVAKQDRSKAEQIKLKASEEAEALNIMAKARERAKESALDPQIVFDKKIETLKYIHNAWAQAYAQRNVPTYVFGADSGTTNTAQNDAQVTQQMINALLVKQLALDPNFIKPN